MPKQVTVREPRPSGKQKRFSELAQLLQLQNSVNEPGLRQQELGQRQGATNLNAMLSVLGLAQQGEAGAASRALQEKELAQRAEQSAAQVGAGKERAFVDAATVASTPGVPPAVMKALQLAFPQLAQGQAAAEGDVLKKNIQTMTPMVGAAYQSAGTEPSKLHPLLETIKASNPEAFAGLDWNTLNEAAPVAKPRQPLAERYGPNSPAADFERVGSGVKNLFSPETMKRLFGQAYREPIK